MPSTQVTVEITVRECLEDPWIIRKFLGAWWWSVRISGMGTKSGFARSRDKAVTGAQRAARHLVAKPHPPYETCTYEIPTAEA